MSAATPSAGRYVSPAARFYGEDRPSLLQVQARAAVKFLEDEADRHASDGDYGRAAACRSQARALRGVLNATA